MDNNLDILKQRLENNKEYLTIQKAELDVLKKQIVEKEEAKETLIEDNTKLLTMKMLIEEASTEARENGRKLLSDVATTSAQTVFGKNTEIELEPFTKDGVPSIRVIIKKHLEDGNVIIINPTEADGGGLADITDLSIFMALGQMIQNNYAPYDLDEPTKFINGLDLIEKSAQFIRNMVDFTGKQTIISTNEDLLASEADTRYRMVLDEKTSISTAYKEV